MLKKRYSLSGGEVLVVFAALVLLGGLNVLQLVPADRRDRPQDAALPLSERPMRGDMKRAYERWDQRDTSYAVFARGANSYGWTDGYLDPEAAREDALAWCSRHGADCVVIEERRALTVVEGVDVPVTDALVPIVSRVMATQGHVVLAVAGTGAFAMGQGETAEQAAQRALALCQTSSAKDREAFLPVHPCRVLLQR